MTKEFKKMGFGRLESLIDLFNSTFMQSHNTVIEGGADEPYYLPAGIEAASALGSERFHRIIFTRDYFSSALHEIAHWCIAGAQRRAQPDYGYWYAPDGRSEAQQQAFEQVEVKPQALERIFARASGQAFRISADNLNGGFAASEEFAQNIHQQTLEYCKNGLPKRAQQLVDGMQRVFNTKNILCASEYSLEELL